METAEEFSRRLARGAFARGDHRVSSWRIEYEDGEDGCMPSGWYLLGLDRHGGYNTFPVRHEYGPYETTAGAETDAKVLALNWGPVT